MIAAIASPSSKRSILFDSSVNRARYRLRDSPLSCLIDHRYILVFFWTIDVANRARNMSFRSLNERMLPGLKFLNHSKPGPARVRLKAWHMAPGATPCIVIQVS